MLGRISFAVPVLRREPSSADANGFFAMILHVNHCGAGRMDRTDIDQCPDYAIALWSDGLVEYQGLSGVRTLGHREHTIARDAVDRLRSAVAASGFFQMQSYYESGTTPDGRMFFIDHAAEKWVTIRVGQVQKTVHDFYGAPDTLHALEAAIEKAADSHRYTGREDRR